MAFHDRLKEARIKSNYTQDQLAEILGIGKSTLSGYENGNREPTISTIAKIIDTLNPDAGQKLEALIRGDHPESKQIG